MKALILKLLAMVNTEKGKYIGLIPGQGASIVIDNTAKVTIITAQIGKNPHTCAGARGFCEGFRKCGI